MKVLQDFVRRHPTAIHDPNFHETLSNLLMSLSSSSLTKEQTLEQFYATIYPRRSYTTSFITSLCRCLDYQSHVIKTLEQLHQQPHLKQRSKEWYEFRYCGITASNAYLMFGSVSEKNRLIVEKCQDLPSIKLELVMPPTQDSEESIESLRIVNIDNPLQWGHKYEPLSCMLYELEFDTEIGEFGCLCHNKYPFLRASPDGINVKKDNPRFGRLLEIKNPISRTITGVPKKEYYIQTQMQMAVCDLYETDFLETSFKEYADETEFWDDVSMPSEPFVSKDQKRKGVILYFVNKTTGCPVFLYQPLDLVSRAQFDEWFEQQLHERGEENVHWVRPIFWKLDVFSCVLVPFNSVWFETNVKVMKEFWTVIETERKTEEWKTTRLPKKRTKTLKPNVSTDPLLNMCLVKPPQILT